MAGYILTTSYDGGLTITDIKTDEILWFLPQVRYFPLQSARLHAAYHPEPGPETCTLRIR